jgi:hypothetical protein
MVIKTAPSGGRIDDCTTGAGFGFCNSKFSRRASATEDAIAAMSHEVLGPAGLAGSAAAMAVSGPPSANASN